MTLPVSRRHFIQAAGASAAVWVPTPVNGHGAGAIARRAAAAGVSPRELGISIWDLDTPALVVDLATLESNIATMQRSVGQQGIASRPHAKTHKTPAIARMQLEAGSVGICVAKIGEAEALFDHGIDRLLMTTSNVTPFKIGRAMHLRRRCDGLIQTTDTPANARLLSEAAEAAGLVADVVVDVDPGGHRTGITPGRPAVELARLVDRLPGLRLRGMLCYDGGSQHVQEFETRQRQTLERLAPAAETLDAFRRDGLSTEIFSGGAPGRTTSTIKHRGSPTSRSVAMSSWMRSTWRSADARTRPAIPISSRR